MFQEWLGGNPGSKWVTFGGAKSQKLEHLERALLEPHLLQERDPARISVERAECHGVVESRTPAKPKVSEHYPVGAFDEDVRGLDVAVNQSSGVQRLERRAELLPRCLLPLALSILDSATLPSPVAAVYIFEDLKGRVWCQARGSCPDRSVPCLQEHRGNPCAG
jgi:hypothetical protein